MKYKVGDKVRVRSWEDMEKEFGLDEEGCICMNALRFAKGMKIYCGKIVEIVEVKEDSYRVIGNCWQWTDDMFEPADFNWDAFKDKSNKIAVHCKTKEEAKDFCRRMHEHGMTWCTCRSYLDITNFDVLKREICYTGYGTFSSYGKFKEENFTILEYEDYFMNKEKETKKEFTIDDLKHEMIVKTRNKHLYVVIGDKLIGENGYMKKSSYTKDFKCTKSSVNSSDYDIVAVYPPNGKYGLGFKSMLTPNAEPIWVEEKEVVIPDDCKNILKVIDKEYNWIAKDANGVVCIYKDKPVKGKGYWECSEYDCKTLPRIFGDLFDWLSWEDEEPVNFKEVLKEE